MSPSQALNDGIVKIYGVNDAANPGEAPSEVLTLKGQLNYKRRTIGFGRYYTAMQASAKVDMLLRCPYVAAVSTQDVAIPCDGEQYRITLIQAIEDSAPPMMDLTLERLEQNYDLPRHD
ncbi:MAG: hypothetical protein RSE64_08075 [Oscillospiraceae bacterium]